MAVSTNRMIQQLAEIQDDTKVEAEDRKFIVGIVIATQGGTITNTLTPKHHETLRRVWHKFFAG